MRVIAMIWLAWGVFGSILAQDSLPGAAMRESVSGLVVVGGGRPAAGFSDSVRGRLADFAPMPSGCRLYGGAVGGYVESHPYFPSLGVPVYGISRERAPSGMDWLFYTLLGSLAYFGMLRIGYGRYLSDLYTAMFDRVMRQALIREQLARQVLPSQLMNLQFLVNTAIFAHLLVPDLRLPGLEAHGVRIVVFMFITAAVYAVKSVCIWMVGFLTGRPAEAEGYLFTVMLVNKIAGIALMPLNILLAYLGGEFSAPVNGVVLLCLAVLFGFRVFRCYEFVQREFQAGAVAYLLFLASFEVMPLLVAGKLLLGVFFPEIR